MTTLNILGVDPSLNNFAMALVSTTRKTAPELVVVNVDLIRTDSRLSDLERAQIITDAFMEYSKKADMVITELPYGSRSARASWTLGIVVGVLACSTKPIITVSAKQVKAITGKKTASKDQMLAWGLKSFPHAKWFKDSRGQAYKYNHHIADALAAIVAGITYKNKEFINGTTLSKKKSVR